MPEPAGLERRVTDSTCDGATMGAIRRAVFVVEQGVPAQLEWDGLVAGCTHVLARMNRDPVGTGRLLPTGRIGRLAVVAGARRHGIGRGLRRGVELARAQGLMPVYLHAQVSSASCCEAHGCVAEGAEFDEAGIRHRRMRLAVPAQQRTDAAPGGAAHAALVRRRGTHRRDRGRGLGAPRADAVLVQPRARDLRVPGLHRCGQALRARAALREGARADREPRPRRL